MADESNPSTTRRTNRIFTADSDRKSNKLAHSPLKSVIENAISKVAVTMDFTQTTSPSRPSFNKNSSRPNFNNNHNESGDSSLPSFRQVSASGYQFKNQKLHPETQQFLQNYNFNNYGEPGIPTSYFVDSIIREYDSLWDQTYSVEVMQSFKERLFRKLGAEYVNMKRLTALTAENGIIGLILNTFRQLKNSATQQPAEYRQVVERDSVTSSNSNISKNPEIMNLKNVIQQFVEGLYKSMEKDIYSRLNKQMRKLVLKYTKVEDLLNLVNEKININYDKIVQARQVSRLQRENEIKITELNDKITKLTQELHEAQVENKCMRIEISKLGSENEKITNKLEKFQEALLKNSDKSTWKANNDTSNNPLASFNDSYPSEEESSTRSNSNLTTRFKLLSIPTARTPKQYPNVSPTAAINRNFMLNQPEPSKSASQGLTIMIPNSSSTGRLSHAAESPINSEQSYIIQKENSRNSGGAGGMLIHDLSRKSITPVRINRPCDVTSNNFMLKRKNC